MNTSSSSSPAGNRRYNPEHGYDPRQDPSYDPDIFKGSVLSEKQDDDIESTYSHRKCIRVRDRSGRVQFRDQRGRLYDIIGVAVIKVAVIKVPAERAHFLKLA